MRYSILFCCLFLGSLWSGETHFSIIICSYNNEQFCEWCLNSCLLQYYDNFHVYYVNDASTDDTLINVKKAIKKSGQQKHITLINNKKRKESALANQDYVIRNLVPDDSVCVLVDGDDALADHYVLEYLDGLYSAYDIWATLGSMLWRNEFRVDVWTAPRAIKQCNCYRHYITGPLHLRTFYASLYKKIDVSDLMQEGDYVKYASDVPLFFPIMEMAGDHLYFPAKVLYIYNDDNPISEYARTGICKKQRENSSRFIAMRRYKPLENR